MLHASWEHTLKKLTGRENDGYHSEHPVSNLSKATTTHRQPRRNRKSPEQNGLPVELLKVVAKSHSHLLVEMYNSCMAVDKFPLVWKTTKFILIKKCKGPVDAAMSISSTFISYSLQMSQWRCAIAWLWRSRYSPKLNDLHGSLI